GLSPALKRVNHSQTQSSLIELSDQSFRGTQERVVPSPAAPSLSMSWVIGLSPPTVNLKTTKKRKNITNLCAKHNQPAEICQISSLGKEPWAIG
ncbi:hypothetical protein, partial [Pseudovibrio denitrificans]|uniref:hypothetical protein n=1 Tax=Pseudovibrio denitrificans TaxID=258256 RepID=UPI001AD8AC47